MKRPPNPDVREEVLEQQFAQHLARLRIDEEVFEWITRSLSESCSDEKREHNDAIARLQTEWPPRSRILIRTSAAKRCD